MPAHGAPSRRPSGRRERLSPASWMLALLLLGGVLGGLGVVGCLAAVNDPPERQVEEPPRLPLPVLADYQGVVTVFGTHCTECHAGAGAPAGLSLTAGDAYGALVEVSSSEIPDRQRVAPGDPDASYLVQKLRGGSQCKTCPDDCAPQAICGEQMPLGRPPLQDGELALIEDWIRAGAPGPAADGGPADMTGDVPSDMTGDVPVDMTGSDGPPVDATPADMTPADMTPADMTPY